MTVAKPARRDREARRSEIVEAARGLFLAQPYDEVGMADLVALGVASRPSVYRYFPGGPSEVFVAVATALVEELRDRLRHAAQGPFSPAKRMEHLLAALFTDLTVDPAAYRLLFQDVWAVRDEAARSSVVAARALLAAEVAAVVASGGGAGDDVLLVSTGILGCALANIELALSGAVEAEAALRVTCAVAVAALAAPGP
jgi:AcrR family transcriptional regulator